MQAEAEIRARLAQPATTPAQHHEERRKTVIRSGGERRVARMASPTGVERRSGRDRRVSDRRMAQHSMAAAAGQA